MPQLKRQAVLDIETTGLSPLDGHRVIEIAVIEMVDGAVTSHYFHHRLNPECEIEDKASSILGLTWAMLEKEPKFSEVADEFLGFIADAELIMHHAPFNLDFLNAELRLSGRPELTNSVVDTLAIARALHPDQKNHLDALCERYQINQTYLEASGVLQGARAIANIYLTMSVDWTSFIEEVSDSAGNAAVGKLLDLAEAKRFLVNHPTFQNTDADLSTYIYGTAEAFDYLGKQGYDGCIDIGLTELTQDIACAFAGWEALLNFDKIRSLSVEVAAILSESRNSLVFSNESLGEISADVARELGKLEQPLSLRIERLTLEAARELVKHSDDLTLELDTPPDVQVLQALCFHVGYRLAVYWERLSGGESCVAPLFNSKKRTFVAPHFNEHTGRWCEAVYIGDMDFYSDSLVDLNGITTVL